MEKVIKYNHHGADVSVREDLKGKHREHCLCFSCSKFMDGSKKCKIADAVYQNCKDFNIVSPVWECPEFK